MGDYDKRRGRIGREDEARIENPIAQLDGREKERWGEMDWNEEMREIRVMLM